MNVLTSALLAEQETNHSLAPPEDPGSDKARGSPHHPGNHGSQEASHRQGVWAPRTTGTPGRGADVEGDRRCSRGHFLPAARSAES